MASSVRNFLIGFFLLAVSTILPHEVMAQPADRDIDEKIERLEQLEAKVDVKLKKLETLDAVGSALSQKFDRLSRACRIPWRRVKMDMESPLRV